MPFWPAFATPAIPEIVARAMQDPPAVSQEAPQTRENAGYVEVGEGVLVRAKRTTFRPNGVIEFSDGVEAIYDVTTIKADRLVAHTKKGEEFAEATGKVEVIDPDGHIAARSLRIEWATRIATAEDVEITVPHLFIRAKQVSIKGTRWEATDARITPCGREIPIFEVGVKNITLETGKGGMAKNPSIRIGGKKIGEIPSQRINLDPRATGVKLPGISYRASDGLGLTWSNGRMLNENTSLEMSFGAFENTRPDASVTLTRSFIDAARTNTLIAPKSDLSERFGNAYMERIRVGSPVSEEKFLKEPRRSMSVSSVINTGANVSYRRDQGNFSKPLEVVYEQGGPALGGALLAQGRAQTILEGKGSLHARAVLVGTYLTDPLKLADNLGIRFRVDSAGYVGNQASGWLRASANLAWQPHHRVVLGASVGAGKNFGDPLYGADLLDKLRNVNLRADLDLGPTKLGVLIKIDPRTGKTYDQEFMISQIAGCFEPFLMSRTYPNAYQLGLRFRGGDFYDALRRRVLKREPPAPPRSKVFISQPLPPR